MGDANGFIRRSLASPKVYSADGASSGSSARIAFMAVLGALAVDDWEDFDFRGFGSELGTIMRDILLLAFPQKYHVDANGFIRRSLASPKVYSADGSAGGHVAIESANLFPGAR